jgi:hypothetical protein
MKFVIVETWNGEGYSYENLIRLVKDFDSEEDAKQFCKETLEDEQISAEEVYPLDTGYGWSYRDDDGSYQCFKMEEDSFGVIILCNVNDVKVVNKESYFKELDGYLNTIDISVIEEEEIERNESRVFLHAEYADGDHDIQFEIIIPKIN